jgi:hypothetical protein
VISADTAAATPPHKTVQRAVRLAVNAINSGLDEWKVGLCSALQVSQAKPTLPTSLPLHAQAAVGDGKQHATALTNAILTQLHLPAMPLTLLGEATELRAAATVKLSQQQVEAVAQLAGCLERLRCAMERLAEAAAGLQQLLDSEASAPLLMEGAVFATLPLRVLGNMAAEVERMHRAELDVKAAVLHGFQQILGVFAAILQGIQ